MKLVSVNISGDEAQKKYSTDPPFIISEDNTFIEEVATHRRLRLDKRFGPFDLRPDANPLWTHVEELQVRYATSTLYDVAGKIINDRITLNPRLSIVNKKKNLSDAEYDTAIYINMETESFIPVKYELDGPIFVAETFKTTGTGCLLIVRHGKMNEKSTFKCYGYRKDMDIRKFKLCGYCMNISSILHEAGSYYDEAAEKMIKYDWHSDILFECSQFKLDNPNSLEKRKLVKEIKSRFYANKKKPVHLKVSSEIMIPKYYCGQVPEADVKDKIVKDIESKCGYELPWKYIKLPQRTTENGVDPAVLEALNQFSRVEDHMRVITVADDNCYIRHSESRAANINYIIQLRDDGSSYTIKSN